MLHNNHNFEKEIYMVYLFGGQKGGTGKSTIAASVAVALQEQKKELVILDADPQGTLLSWSERRLSKKIVALSAKNDIRSTVNSLDNKYDNVVIDTGGRDSKEWNSALLVSDVVFIPIEPTMFSLDSLIGTIEGVEYALAKGATPLICFVISRAKKGTKNITDLKKALIAIADQMNNDFGGEFCIYFKANNIR